MIVNRTRTVTPAKAVPPVIPILPDIPIGPAMA